MNYDMHLWQSIEWRKDKKYYRATIQQDIFGTWIVERIWGRINSKIGNHKTNGYTNYTEATETIITIKKQRQYRGYAAYNVINTHP